jgi:RNA polymerase sigma-70 factor (ECF subfamily)
MKDESLQRAVSGDREALRRVVDLWWPQIRRWALYQCADATLAEDAVQEALVRLVRFIPSYDPLRPFGPWLRTLVRHACHDQLARQSLDRKRHTPVQETMLTSPSAPGRDLDLSRAAREVIRQFEELSPRQREIIDLVDLQGMAPADAAVHLGISAKAVRSQLSDARRRLRSVVAHREHILPLLREA